MVDSCSSECSFYLLETLPEIGGSFALYVVGGHDHKLDVSQIIKIFRLKCQCHQHSISFNECLPKRHKVTRLCAGGDETTDEAALSHNGTGYCAFFPFFPSNSKKL